MAKKNPLSAIRAEAKRIRKKHPKKYSRMKNPWAKGYMVEAGKRYRSGAIGKKRATVKKKAAVKKKPRKRKAPAGRKLVKYVERTATEKVMAGKKRKRRRKARAKHTSTRRVSGKGGTGLLMGLAVGALGLYLLTKDKQPTTYNQNSLPPITQTSNFTRNSQSQDIVNYAIAAGLTINAIASLIDMLNGSSDEKVSQVYNDVNLTGNLSPWIA
jgi:hypothetical protein